MRVIAALVASWVSAQSAPVPPVSSERAAPSLEELRAWVEDLRCSDALPALDALTAENAPAPERRSALFLRGYCRSIAGLTASADEDFRAAWVIDLEAPVPIQVEPGVLIVIDGARETVLRAREEERRSARDMKRSAVLLDASGPLRIAGGRRLPIEATITDPQQLVTRLRFEFRREKEKDAFTLPMQRDDEGQWRGEIPGLYTLTPDGPFTMTWRVFALDDEGVLAESSIAASPQSTYVSEDESLVPELRANERLPHPQRVLYASLGFGAAVVFTGLATAVTGSLLALTFAEPAVRLNGIVEDDGWSARELAFKGLAAGAPLAATTGVAYAAMDPLIDGGWKIVPPLIVFASALPSAVTALVFDPTDATYLALVAGSGVIVGGAGTAIAAVAATIIVSLDTPNSVRDE